MQASNQLFVYWEKTLSTSEKLLSKHLQKSKGVPPFSGLMLSQIFPPCLPDHFFRYFCCGLHSDNPSSLDEEMCGPEGFGLCA